MVQGHLGVITPFVRTPKVNAGAAKRGKRVSTAAYASSGGQFLPAALEFFLMIYALIGLFLAPKMGPEGDFGLAPFHLLCVLGFGYLLIKSIFTQSKH